MKKPIIVLAVVLLVSFAVGLVLVPALSIAAPQCGIGGTCISDDCTTCVDCSTPGLRKPVQYGTCSNSGARCILGSGSCTSFCRPVCR